MHINTRACGVFGLSYCLLCLCFPIYWFFSFIIAYVSLCRALFIPPNFSGASRNKKEMLR